MESKLSPCGKEAELEADHKTWFGEVAERKR
jgi:hypothetical protein